MTRRGLLGMLAAAVVDPDRLVWVPGRKLISIPAPLPAIALVWPLSIGQPTAYLDYLFHKGAFIWPPLVLTFTPPDDPRFAGVQVFTS